MSKTRPIAGAPSCIYETLVSSRMIVFYLKAL